MDFSKILWNDSRPGQLSIATYRMHWARSRTFELLLGNCETSKELYFNCYLGQMFVSDVSDF